ncbi:hypothetical protein HF086_004752 [Spodoptera exigua]|uniref:DDE-1 domain-containing protein n=1 Tax=Spodoptera exigua TaxID=7107 RepID=A0A922M9Z3_SPOEX|nr:hypothetical protein HF086_004752 [Spodoptera exigua]
MTVVQAPNVIARKGTKQIGQCVSAKRGQLITMCGIVNAIGNALPPVFIFPRALFHDSMLFGAPTGSVGYANSPTSGWMIGPLFIKVLEHLKRLTRCSKEDPILLLMDNHESHSVSPPSTVNVPEADLTETWIAPSVAASTVVITPEAVKPFPRALPRKESNKGRKTGKSRILTNTPEKDEIQKAYLERQARLKKSQEKVLNKRRAKTKALKRKKTKTILTFSSDETDSEIHLESEEEKNEDTDEN